MGGVNAVISYGRIALCWLMLFFIAGALSGNSSAPERLDPASLTKYVDELPKPAVLRSERKLNGETHYEVKMTQFKHRFHRDLPPATVWGYGDSSRAAGTYPGPTIEVRQNEKVAVKWINDIAATRHLLPVDKTIHGAGSGVPEVRTVVHVHGAHVYANSDGFPEAWFTRNFAQKGRFWEQEVYHYINDEDPTTLWYHDHALGITRLNVYAGLAGFWLIRGPEEDRLNLPKGEQEIPLLIQDRSFYRDGSLYYPTRGFIKQHPIWNPEFFADVAVVNGKAWPYLDVEPRKYRLRLLNGANARFFEMQLLKMDESLKYDAKQMTWRGTPGPAFQQIGSDGGLLQQPVVLNELLLAPAERADVIIDFSGIPDGTEFILTNDAPAPYSGSHGDGNGDSPAVPEIMKIRVTRPLVGSDTQPLPSTLTTIQPIPERSATVVRDLTLNEELIDDGQSLVLLLDGRHWGDPVSESPMLGSTEIWNLVNLTEDTHPIHLHLIEFQVLDRQELDVEAYEAYQKAHEGRKPPSLEPYLKGPKIAPARDERGWKDTIRANPRQVTRIISQPFDLPGLYVWHCHILEHEDNEMMRPMYVRRDKNDKPPAMEGR